MEITICERVSEEESVFVQLPLVRCRRVDLHFYEFRMFLSLLDTRTRHLEGNRISTPVVDCISIDRRGGALMPAVLPAVQLV